MLKKNSDTNYSMISHSAQKRKGSHAIDGTTHPSKRAHYIDQISPSALSARTVNNTGQVATKHVVSATVKPTKDSNINSPRTGSTSDANINTSSVSALHAKKPENQRSHPNKPKNLDIHGTQSHSISNVEGLEQSSTSALPQVVIDKNVASDEHNSVDENVDERLYVDSPLPSNQCVDLTTVTHSDSDTRSTRIMGPDEHYVMQDTDNDKQDRYNTGDAEPNEALEGNQKDEQSEPDNQYHYYHQQDTPQLKQQLMNKHLVSHQLGYVDLSDCDVNQCLTKVCQFMGVSNASLLMGKLVSEKAFLVKRGNGFGLLQLDHQEYSNLGVHGLFRYYQDTRDWHVPFSILCFIKSSHDIVREQQLSNGYTLDTSKLTFSTLWKAKNTYDIKELLQRNRFWIVFFSSVAASMKKRNIWLSSDQLSWTAVKQELIMAWNNEKIIVCRKYCRNQQDNIYVDMFEGIDFEHHVCSLIETEFLASPKTMYSSGSILDESRSHMIIDL